jgi:hypothetical protein
MLATNRSFSLVILLALLVSLILSAVVAPVITATQPSRITYHSTCSDQDTMLLIEFNPSRCEYGARMP